LSLAFIRDILPFLKLHGVVRELPKQIMANLFELPRYIAVEGPIRVGKSTLARILAERLNAQRIMESEENPFLDSFYDGDRGAAFQAQFTFLVRRFQLLQALDLGPRSQKTVVSDFIFEKDKLFACLNLTDQELDTYNRYYNHFREQLPTPDLVIYLQATPEVLKRRLKRKNAPSERAVSDEYLEEVIKAYEHFFFHYTSSDLLIVNTSEIDFVDRNEDLQELLRKVSEPIKGTQYFLPLGGQEAASA
jgi:deoxyguanosine kinase